MGYFGTDGIRAKQETFSYGFLEQFAKAVFTFFKAKTIAIARDTRTSGCRIEGILTELFLGYGVAVHVIGIAPTPVLAFYTARVLADVGIMISASHNPPDYNGLKLFASNGRKLTNGEEKAVEELMDKKLFLPKDYGGEEVECDACGDYIKWITDRLKPDIADMRVLLDTANGAAAVVAPRLFEACGCRAETVFCDTNGKNINVGCGAAAPEAFIKTAQNGRYDLGFTFDGDADRALCYCNGKLIDGDGLIYVFAKYMKENGEAPDTVVGTVMTNYGCELALANMNVTLVRTDVGDKNVYAKMVELKCALGGESSGHVILAKHQQTGDGLLTALAAADIGAKKNLADYCDLEPYIQVHRALPLGVGSRAQYANDLTLKASLDKLIADAECRLVIRPSGTEPVLRVMSEAKTRAAAENAVATAETLIRSANYE